MGILRSKLNGAKIIFISWNLLLNSNMEKIYLT